MIYSWHYVLIRSVHTPRNDPPTHVCVTEARTEGVAILYNYYVNRNDFISTSHKQTMQACSCVTTNRWGEGVEAKSMESVIGVMGIIMTNSL